MDIDSIVASSFDQDKGSWWSIRHPMTGAETDMRFKIAGPDSYIQTRARYAMLEELQASANRAGGVTNSPEVRDKAMINFLAKIVIDWEVKQGGKPCPLTHENIVRLISAARWIREQCDAYAGSYQPWGNSFEDKAARESAA